MLGIDVSQNQTARESLSVVIPIHNEEETIPELIKQLTSVLSSLNLTYEIVFVNDASRDTSLEVLEGFAKQDSHIKVISFSRNFGHQMAITAGMEYATGSAVVVMDGDLQDPPETIRDMVTKWQEGFDVVYAVRKAREGETFLKKLTAKAFYRILKTLTHFPIPVDTGDFRLITRPVVNVYLAMGERERYVRGMIAWMGFKQTGVEFYRQSRTKGETKFTYGKMMRFAFDGITSFSYIPLQLASFLGFICSGISFLLLIYVFYAKFFDPNLMRGWTSTLAIVIFIGGIQLTMIGLLGEYLGRLHMEQKRRPLYVVNKTTNITKPS